MLYQTRNQKRLVLISFFFAKDSKWVIMFLESCMKTVELLIGTIGTGKSTLARELIKSSGGVLFCPVMR